MSKRELIDIQTPNKDILTSFVYAWSRQKEMSLIEQRVVLRIIERASNAINGIKLKDNMRKLDVGLRTAWPHGRGDGHSQDTSTFSILRRFCADFRF